MTRFLNRKKKVFRSIVVVRIYCLVGFPISDSIDVGATEPVNMSMGRSQLPGHLTGTPFSTVHVFLEMFEKGKHAQAKKTLDQAEAVFPKNYAVPYYLGIIYLEEDLRSAAIAEWQQYVLMDPKKQRLPENPKAALFYRFANLEEVPDNNKGYEDFCFHTEKLS